MEARSVGFRAGGWSAWGPIVARWGLAVGGSGVEVGEGDGLVAVGAEPSGPEAPAEQLAVVAAADTEVAGLA